MSASMTANDWRTLFYNCAMWLVSHIMCLLVVAYTTDACLFRLLFAIIVDCVRALILLDGGVLVRCVLDLVLCAGAVVLIVGFFWVYTYFILCLATVDCSSLGTTYVDTVETFWVGCVIDLS